MTAAFVAALALCDRVAAQDEQLFSVSKTLTLSLTQGASTDYLVADLEALKQPLNGATQAPADLPFVDTNVWVGGLWHDYGTFYPGDKYGYILDSADGNMHSSGDVDFYQISGSGQEVLSGSGGEGIWFFGFEYWYSVSDGSSWYAFTASAQITALQNMVVNYNGATNVYRPGEGFEQGSGPPMLIRAAQPPTAIATTSTPVIAAGSLVSLDGTTSHENNNGATTIQRWDWQFDNTTDPSSSFHDTSVFPTLTRALSSPGDWRVTLTVTDSLGQMSTATSDSSVAIKAVQVTFNPPSVTLPQFSMARTTATIVPGDAASSVSFDTGNHSIATVAPTSLSTPSGPLTVSGIAVGGTQLKAILTPGSVVCGTGLITVNPPSDAPVAVAGVDNPVISGGGGSSGIGIVVTVPAGYTLTVDGSHSFVIAIGATHITLYQWLFINTTSSASPPIEVSSTSPTLSLTLSDPGDYQVTLTVTDDLGNVSTGSTATANATATSRATSSTTQQDQLSIQVVGVTFLPTSLTVFKGAALTVEASIAPADAAGSVAFFMDNPSVATVDKSFALSDDETLTITGVSPGITRLHALVTTGSGETATSYVDIAVIDDGDTHALAITTPAASITNPAWVEGTTGFAVQSVSAQINGGVPFSATRLSSTDWFASPVGASPLGIPISATAPTNLRVFSESRSVTQSLTWTPTDILNAPSMIFVRKGDSLLLTGTTNTHAKMLEIYVNGVRDFYGLPGTNFPFQFSTPGTYTVTATIRKGGGGPAAGKGQGNGLGGGNDAPIAQATIAVVVIEVTELKPVDIQVGYTRTQAVADSEYRTILPADQIPDIYFLPNDPFLLQVSETVDNGTANLHMTPLKRGHQFLLARLGSSTGPALSIIPVNEFTFDDTSAVGLMIANGADSGVATFTMHPFIPSMEFDFNMFAHTSTFLGGATSFTINTSESLSSLGETGFQQVYNPTTGEYDGRFQYTIEMPSDESMYCRNEQGFQDGNNQSATFQVPGNGHKVDVTWDHIWFFNNVPDPEHYSSTTNLTAKNATTHELEKNVAWTITVGQGKITLDGDKIASTKNPSLMKSTAASAPAAQLTRDISVQVAVDGTEIGSILQVVLTPARWIFTANKDSKTIACFTLISYDMQDQFNTLMPFAVPINEKFTTGITPLDDPSANWTRNKAAGGTLPPKGPEDQMGFETGFSAALVPQPVMATDPAASQPIWHCEGEWRVGSANSGEGVQVTGNWGGNGDQRKTCKWHLFRGYGRHE
jgi:hypothetical protein